MPVFSHRLGNDIQTFGKRLSKEARTFGRKMNFSNISSGMHDFNQFANPALSLASMSNPMFIPYTAAIGAGLNAVEHGAKFAARFEGENQQAKPHHPRLER